MQPRITSLKAERKEGAYGNCWTSGSSTCKSMIVQQAPSISTPRRLSASLTSTSERSRRISSSQP